MEQEAQQQALDALEEIRSQLLWAAFHGTGRLQQRVREVIEEVAEALGGHVEWEHVTT